MLDFLWQGASPEEIKLDISKVLIFWPWKCCWKFIVNFILASNCFKELKTSFYDSHQGVAKSFLNITRPYQYEFDQMIRLYGRIRGWNQWISPKPNNYRMRFFPTGRVRKQEKGKGISQFLFKYYISWWYNFSITSKFCNYSFKIDKKEGIINSVLQYT